MENNEWIDNIVETVDLQRLKKKDFRSTHIKMMLKQFARLAVEKETECPTCKQNKMEIEFLANNIQIYFNEKEFDKIDYESRFEKVFSHFKTAHHLVSSSHFKSLYTLLGIAFSAIVIAILYYSNAVDIDRSGVLLVLGVSMTAGWVVGSRKDAKTKKEGRSI